MKLEGKIIHPVEHPMEIETFSEHKTLIGKYIRSYTKNKWYPYPSILFSDPEAPEVEFLVPAYGNLKYQLKNVKPGKLVKMVYTGDKQFKKGKGKQFSVYIGGD
jgi:hypothetical protein